MIGLRSLGDDKDFIKTFSKTNRRNGGTFGGKRDENLGVRYWSDQGGCQDVTSLNAGFLGRPQLFNDGGHGGNGGEDNNQGDDNGKSRLERNTPELMIVNLGLLGLFEMKELIFGKEVAMIVGTSKDGDGFRDRVVFNAGHSLATFGADRGSGRDDVGFGQNRVDIFGSFNGEEVGYVGEKKVTTTV